ncbi:hypothetical protein F9C07_2252363 [Aspergillus flavus]|uniref:CCZ1/INTU/HSP4 first Longin domain-containing protein n=4 Tax=Aspergillus subgen. Circumdati TaxID=2720871 RepID=A0A7U2ME56_ASPFN|nr:uncharacterized protein G4B84_002869 [Aspergillus flavus NRRL3357]KAB8242040.1 hypothetical protein BDV35DRAFT_397128 [Aspergillus flavus]KDE83537.1 hypothetical protein AO1008_10073 [Aspergillus oryzae 100-8]OOO10767.1 hypothetical protein OAory_01065750 [Aspergillus oryzae]KAF7620004.1 hypothetical protein AFLA_001622 [Aspergillus flavus NRRL3357]QMW27580.1 hypothetical protein G4B84_002869 [Aspergillus flavus NRRL3357]
MSGSDLASVVPAQLAYLTIYNPLLGPTDETIQDQVVFYTSRSDRLRRSGSFTTDNENKETNDGWNVRLRQIGLAQGMVSFARNFSKGEAVDYVETDKSLIVLHELEKNWWILASIDLTRLPTHSSSGPSSQHDASETSSSSHYSSREMCPSHHLIQQLRRAHSIFLLHHDITLDALYKRVGRSTFCPLLENFWLRFAWNWDILLSGNPAVDVYNGIKLSAGGELGIGVGEEEWGSGEREVFEDFVARTDGLVDLVVSRFGDPNTLGESAATANKSADTTRDDDETHWLGLDTYPRPSDGVIFSGVGTISRSSVVRISQWMEWIYKYGIDAYGVGEDPTSPRRRKHRRRQRGRPRRDANAMTQARGNSQSRDTDGSFSPGIPRPLVVGTTQSTQPPQGPDGVSLQSSGETSPARSDKGSDWMGVTTGTFVKYLTLGYGSSWSMSRTPSAHPRVEALKREDDSASSNKQTGPPTDGQEGSEESPSVPEDPPKPESRGKFLIGLKNEKAKRDSKSLETDPTIKKSRDRITQRTLHMYLANPSEDNPSGTIQQRAVVYIHKPFIYTFLFDPQASSLADPSLYHSIHHQLQPLQGSLSKSTSPANAAARISVSGNAVDINQRFSAENLPFYDLVYDPTNLTIRSSIPNIPDLGFSPLEAPRDPSATPWSRVESLNIHHRLLSTYIETRSRPLELERTCKTSRGWWIVWVRMSDPSYKPTSDDSSISHPDDPRQEAFLIRKASDHVSTSSHARSHSGTRFFRDLGGASSPGLSDMGPAKLAEGLGLDARRYIESLLNLNR